MAESNSPERPAPRPFKPTNGDTPEIEAQRHGTSLERLSHPEAQRFYSILSRLDNVHSDAVEGKHDLQLPNLARTRDLFNAPDMALPLSDRYGAVEYLLEAGMTVMTEGMGTDPLPHLNDFVARMLNRALNQIGSEYEVVKKPQSSKTE